MVRGSASVSVYAFTDNRGAVVGFVPTGSGLPDSSLPEHQRGWYSPERVRTFVAELGVIYTEAASYGTDLPRLNRDFPGAVNHVRLITVLRWADVVTCLLGGIAFVVIPAASAPDTHGIGGWIVGALMFVLGVSLLWLGARTLPAVARRRAARQAAHPSDAADRHEQGC